MTLEEGIWPELDVSPGAADVLAKLDGRRTLRELSADATTRSPRAASCSSSARSSCAAYIRALSASTPATNGFVTL